MERRYESLSKYGIDMVEQAEKGKLDPVIGRDDEIRRVIQVLARRTKVLKEKKNKKQKKNNNGKEVQFFKTGVV